jgi:hypothetical protein
MARKRKAEREADEAEFGQQTSKFKNPDVRHANFHVIAESGTRVDTSVLTCIKSQPQAMPPAGAPAHSDYATCDNKSKSKKQTQVSTIMIDEILSPLLTC